MAARAQRPGPEPEKAALAGETAVCSDAARELVGCLPNLCEGDRRLLSVICGVLLEAEDRQGPSAALAVVEQMAMVVGARRPGDG